MEIIRATSDIFFKFLFGKEENKDLLLSFINAVHADSGFALIKTVEIKNPFNIKNFSIDKESIVDVKATDENGRIYDVEVQTSGNDIFKNRTLYYWAKLYSSQLKESNLFSKLKPTICINVLDFDLFKEYDYPHSCYNTDYYDYHRVTQIRFFILKVLICVIRNNLCLNPCNRRMK